MKGGHIPAPDPDHNIVAVYPYIDEAGELLFQVVRKRLKQFQQRRPDGQDGWTWSTKGIRRVLYRLPQLPAAIEAGHIIFVAEGEKGVHAIEALGLVGTCSPGGAGKFRKEYAASLAGAHLVILPDNDPQSVNEDGSLRWHADGRPVRPGQDHARDVVHHVAAAAASVRVLELPDLALKGDVFDWVEAGGTWQRLEQLAEDAPGGADWVTLQDALRNVETTRPAAEQVRTETAPLASAEASRSNTLPPIRVINGELSEAVTAGERALIASDQGIYQRSTFIVRPGVVRITVASGHKVPAQHILVMGEFAVQEALTVACPWETYDGRSESWVRKDCPKKVVQVFRDRVGRWTLPVLAGIISAPTLRADGSILSKPGYDRATGLLLDMQGVTFPTIPEYPSKSDAEAALAVLDGLISTFPFVGLADRSVALSAILTAAIRVSLPTAPMHGYTAPAAGSGKSMLVDLCSLIVTGREAGVIAQGKSEQEMEKRLGSLLLAGDTVIAIDNVEEPLGGEFLCQVLTQTVVRARILGKSQAPELPSNAFVTATGNNLTLIGDITRRALLCQLDAKCERPETRKFGQNPLATVRADRGKYLVAALTVLRAYLVAGKPQQKAPLGSFEDWSRWVRDALIWCGKSDPVDTMETARASDPKLNALAAVVSQWHEVIGNGRVSVKSLIEQATVSTSDAFGKPTFNHPDFREALLVVAGTGGAVNSARLGKWLREHKDRVVNYLRIERSGVTHGAATWQLWPTGAPDRGGDG